MLNRHLCKKPSLHTRTSVTFSPHAKDLKQQTVTTTTTIKNFCKLGRHLGLRAPYPHRTGHNKLIIMPCSAIAIVYKALLCVYVTIDCEDVVFRMIPVMLASYLKSHASEALLRQKISVKRGLREKERGKQKSTENLDNI